MTYLQENGFGGREPDPPNFNEPCMVAIGEDGEANRLDHLRLRPGELEHLARLRAARASMERYLRTALFYALRDKAQEQGNIFSILSGTHLNNLAAQAAFEAQRRTKECIMYSYPLKDRGDGKSH